MPKVPTGIKQFLVISPFCFSSYLLFTFKLNLLLHLSSRTTTSSSIWRCTCARSSPPCAAETTSALDHITSQSRFVPAVCVLLFSLLFVYFFSLMLPLFVPRMWLMEICASSSTAWTPTSRRVWRRSWTEHRRRSPRSWRTFALATPFKEFCCLVCCCFFISFFFI